jgi:hypothetical protein
MLVCEPVLTEVVYFLREDGMAVDPLFQLLECEAIRLDKVSRRIGLAFEPRCRGIGKWTLPMPQWSLWPSCMPGPTC